MCYFISICTISLISNMISSHKLTTPPTPTSPVPPVTVAQAYLQLDATPPSVVNNLTSDLSITCTLPASRDVQYAAVSSLILSHASPAVNSQFKYDSVTQFAPKIGSVGPKWDKSGTF